MQIVIDIDDNLYTRLFDNGGDDYDNAVDIATAIRKGTPLPKGHGRLIDGDKAIADFTYYGIDHMWDATDLPYIIDESPTIIEADEESDDE